MAGHTTGCGRLSQLHIQFNSYPYGIKMKQRMWTEWGNDIVNAANSKGWLAFHNPQTSLCRTCKVSEDYCPFRATRNPKTMNDKIKKLPYNIMTHERFLEWIHTDKRADLTKYDIWIDEEPSINETLELDGDEITILKNAFAKQEGQAVVNHIEEIESTPKSGTILDPVSYSLETKKSMQSSVSQTYDPQTRSYFPTDPDVKKLCMKYLTFFKGEATRYAINTPDESGKKITWIRNRLNFDVEGNCYVLNASYNHSLVSWDGFKTVEPLEKKRASGVHIHCIQGNSTKTRLEREIKNLFADALETIKRYDCKKSLLCLNKDPSKTVSVAKEKFIADCLGIGKAVPSVANRGRIIGRNDWYDHDQVITAFGLFSGVANVALLSSLLDGQEVDGKRIWVEKEANGKPIQSPRMGGNGFTDATLSEAYRQLYCHELYQTLMRGVARNWKGESLHVNTFCPSVRHILPIAYDLPGLSIWWNGIDIMGITVSELTKNDTELCKVFGMPDNPNYRKEARALATELLNYWRNQNQVAKEDF